MTEQEFMRIKDGLDSAETDVTPFPVTKNDKIHIVGDANKTEVKKSDYKIRFRVPVESEDGIKYVTKDVEYKNVYITPRQDLKVVKVLAQLLPYFRKIKEDGSVEDFSQTEVMAIIETMDDEIFDNMYDLVQTVLGVNEELKDCMEPASVITAVEQIIRTHPGTVNEADTFFE